MLELNLKRKTGTEHPWFAAQSKQRGTSSSLKITGPEGEVPALVEI